MLKGFGWSLCLAVFGFSTLSKAEVIFTFGGDLNLSPSSVAPTSTGTCKHGRCFNWEGVFSGLQPLLIGQLNFFNLETVLTDGDTNLSPNGGRFLFRTHLEGIRYAKKIGLNWMSLANNHMGDYGANGMLETIESLEDLSKTPGPLIYHGVARTKQELLKPAIIEIKSTTEGTVQIAFAAITFVRNSPMQVGNGRAGVLYPENANDMSILLENFRNTNADFKVLSIHYGTEKQLGLDSGQQKRYRSFLAQGDLDLIIGHHPHRVRPVERVGNKVIFYSLGNYLMVGAETLNGLPDQSDFGLMGRLYLEREAGGRLAIKSVEAIPLFNMQARVYPLTGFEAQSRIDSLNRLSQQELGSSAMQWNSLPNGWGQHCIKSCGTNENLF